MNVAITASPHGNPDAPPPESSFRRSTLTTQALSTTYQPIIAMSEEIQYDLPLNTESPAPVDYTEDDIKTLKWNIHIRRRPGMYIGKLGDGTNNDDGIYVLLKEVLDNSIDEFMMGCGKQILVDVTDYTVTIRDYGRGIPLGSLVAVASVPNTGGKYDSPAF